MDFRLPDDHAALAQLAATILREHGTPQRHGGLEVDGGWFDRDLWSVLAAAGLIGISLSADVGGGGLDVLADHVLLREVGAHAGHVPLFETTVLAAGLVDRCGTPALRERVVGAVVAGQLILTAALEHAGIAATTVTDGFELDGTATLVPCAALADEVVVAAATDDGQLLLALVPTAAPGLRVEPQKTPSDVPHARIVFEHVPLPPEAVLAVGSEAEARLAEHLALASVGLAAMQAGLVAQAVLMAAQHTSTREQFGRPIATFQAVRQRVADARIASEMLSLTSLQAAWLLSEGHEAVDEVLIAKWWTAEAGHHALHAVQHVHGGIGVDRDYPLHRLFGRAKSHEFALGHGEMHLQALGQRIAAAPTSPEAR